MFSLIQNELIKIFKRPGTYVMIALLILLTVITAAFIKYQQDGSEVEEDKNWKQILVAENEALKQQVKNSGAQMEQDYLNREIAINDYRIKHDLSPSEEYNMWSFVTSASELIQLAGLFTIIIAAGIVASEFSWGTIKLLLIRPITRAKILLSKYLTVLIYALVMVSILFVLSTIIGAILFGVPEQASPYLNYYNGVVTEQNIIVHLIVFYVLKSIDMIMLATMAFMISAVFRNSSLAIGLSLFLMFMGGQVTFLIAMKYSWAKYLLFANTDLMQYFEGSPVVEGMTLPFSVSMLIIYFLIFIGLALYVFKKRDVAA
ncbi:MULTISPECIES: ABC transporter permease [unclassified Bacillus (in: firmicutes)]|uniref:ABC transporter permease n=1 Tax=unclassified Bacillus (in: firmicutes) TaxID=185979 RepID=UPI0008EE1B69|nr:MULTISPECIES: ABC transporter permease [unclassified Bacillus (in: firmicutes)]SFA94761.1 ABC-2 type transport system permease protein [Bacillus sp. UNCCL13]SFQ78638.1 ABC-2 type transport system permease protein [Bacillus sp. cl95]